MKKGKLFLLLDFDSIEVVDRDKKVVAQYHPERVEKIFLKAEFRLFKDSISEAVAEFSGETYMLKIDVVAKGVVNTYHFDIDSHYMIVQLKKIIKHWSTQHVNFELQDS